MGQLTQKSTASGNDSYDYDVFGNLRGVNLANGDTIEYLIDPQNRHIGKKINGQVTQKLLYINQLNPIAELYPDNSVKNLFIYADKGNVPSAMERYDESGNLTGKYRIISNHLGSVVMVVNAETGTIEQEIEYDVWGNVLSDSNPSFQPFYFAGGIYDADTKLTRFGARDYDAKLGRWTAKDPIGFAGGLTSLYDYVGQDPVNWIDTTGAAPHKWPDGNYSDNEGQYYDIERDIDNSYKRVGEGIANYGHLAPPVLIGGGFYGGVNGGLGLVCKSAVKPGGWLNSNRYLRIGWSKGKKSKATFRVSGNLIKKVKNKDPHIDLYESQKPFKRGDYEL